MRPLDPKERLALAVGIGGIAVGIIVTSAGVLVSSPLLWIGGLGLGVAMLGYSVWLGLGSDGRDEQEPIAALPATTTARPQPLDLELRNEASKLSDLRGRLRADRLARTDFGPPPEYELGMNAVVSRVTELLREDHPNLIHDFMRDIPPSFISTVLPAGVRADRLDHEMKVRSERLNDIIQKLGQPSPPAAPSPPALSFGRPELAKHPHPIYLPDPKGEQHLLAPGRVIRVAVTNAQGAGDALHVHARLRFLIDRQWGPGETEAEWEGQDGPEVEIDLLGNGRPRLVNVVAVLNWELSPRL